MNILLLPLKDFYIVISIFIGDFHKTTELHVFHSLAFYCPFKAIFEDNPYRTWRLESHPSDKAHIALDCGGTVKNDGIKIFNKHQINSPWKKKENGIHLFLTSWIVSWNLHLNSFLIVLSEMCGNVKNKMALTFRNEIYIEEKVNLLKIY